MEETKDQIRHEFVPKHEILGEEETKNLLETYGIKKEQLPKILLRDPAIQHLNAKRNDVIKITRTSKTAGKSIYYRIVI